MKSLSISNDSHLKIIFKHCSCKHKKKLSVCKASPPKKKEKGNNSNIPMAKPPKVPRVLWSNDSNVLAFDRFRREVWMVVGASSRAWIKIKKLFQKGRLAMLDSAFWPSQETKKASSNWKSQSCRNQTQLYPSLDLDFLNASMLFSSATLLSLSFPDQQFANNIPFTGRQRDETPLNRTSYL